MKAILQLYAELCPDLQIMFSLDKSQQPLLRLFTAIRWQSENESLMIYQETSHCASVWKSKHGRQLPLMFHTNHKFYLLLLFYISTVNKYLNRLFLITTPLITSSSPFSFFFSCYPLLFTHLPAPPLPSDFSLCRSLTSLRRTCSSITPASAN